MKLSDVVKINKNLIELRNSGEKFKAQIGSDLLYNLDLTNEVVDKHNAILSEFIETHGVLDGYEYVFSDDNQLNDKLDELNNLEVKCDLKYLSFDCILNEEFTLKVLELLTPMIIN